MIKATEYSVVTGAFSYTGKYIAQRLLSMGEEVRTLTARPDRENPFGDKVKAFSFNFERPGELTDSLRGAKILYNTYWVRYPHGQVSFDKAVENVPSRCYTGSLHLGDYLSTLRVSRS